MRMSIGVPGISVYFDHCQIKPFIKDRSKKAKSNPFGRADFRDRC